MPTQYMPMTEHSDTTIENRMETIYAKGEARVEDFRIRPTTFSDEEKTFHVHMRVASDEEAYYLSATVTYSEKNPGHHIVIRDHEHDVVDEIETDFTAADPHDSLDVTQSLHETYVQAAKSWYDYALNADKADSQDE